MIEQYFWIGTEIGYYIICAIYSHSIVEHTERKKSLSLRERERHVRAPESVRAYVQLFQLFEHQYGFVIGKWAHDKTVKAMKEVIQKKENDYSLYKKIPTLYIFMSPSRVIAK